MNKGKNIIYWISTVLVVLSTLPGGIGQIYHAKWSIDLFGRLGYPPYAQTIIGTWKVLGSIVLLIPKLPLIKEWAYAGFFFVLSGALYSHIASGESFGQMASALLVLILLVVSWYFRPANRKLVAVTH